MRCWYSYLSCACASWVDPFSDAEGQMQSYYSFGGLRKCSQLTFFVIILRVGLSVLEGASLRVATTMLNLLRRPSSPFRATTIKANLGIHSSPPLLLLLGCFASFSLQCQAVSASSITDSIMSLISTKPANDCVVLAITDERYCLPATRVRSLSSGPSAHTIMLIPDEKIDLDLSAHKHGLRVALTNERHLRSFPSEMTYSEWVLSNRISAKSIGSTASAAADSNLNSIKLANSNTWTSLQNISPEAHAKAIPKQRLFRIENNRVTALLWLQRETSSFKYNMRFISSLPESDMVLSYYFSTNEDLSEKHTEKIELIEKHIYSLIREGKI